MQTVYIVFSVDEFGKKICEEIVTSSEKMEDLRLRLNKEKSGIIHNVIPLKEFTTKKR